MMFMHVVGARPNFMKAAPVMAAFKTRGWRQMLIHTGQHYDELMSDVMFMQLGLPQPDVNLAVGSGSHASQTAAVMTALERVLSQNRPEMLVLYGDVNSTLAGAVTAAKMGVPIAHVEAGVRSHDRSMPEEINRLVTDRLSTVLFAPSSRARENLIAEGMPPEAVHSVGNVMIDTLEWSMSQVDARAVLTTPGIPAGTPYVLVTLHRPVTVDDDDLLHGVAAALSTIAEMHCPVIFPVHPRTRSKLGPAGHPRLHLIGPMGYLEFVSLQKNARLIITDSGGVQVEAAHLGVPCLTFRDNTEWPETIAAGANTLIGRDPQQLVRAATHALSSSPRPFTLPADWDGHTAERIAEVLERSCW